MVVFVAALLAIGAVAFILLIRPRDLPAEDAPSATKHLEDRKARIYEALRDLNFEFRVGKLSDEDYQKTKAGLQADLAQVMAEMDQLQGGAPPPEAKREEAAGLACPHCGAEFSQRMKFCGECGKPMEEAG
jgi:hypothetical protein